MISIPWLTFTLFLIDLVVKIVAIGVVPQNRRPTSASAWLLLILFLPYVGVILFLLIGSPYINKRRLRIQAEANQLLRMGTATLPATPEAMTHSPELTSIVELSRRLTGLPMVTGTNRGIEMSYSENIARMTRMVERATESVHVEIYIVARDSTTEPFFEVLEAAVGRGVTVRLLLDHLGSRKYPGFRKMLRRLSKSGIEWQLMLPFLPLRGKFRRPDLRNHRKLIVVDGRDAMMGSMNLIESTYGQKKNERAGRHWNDIMIEMTGQIVSSLEAVFAVDWYAETGEVIEIHAYRFGEHSNEKHLLPTTHGPEEPVTGAVNAVQLIPSGPGFLTEPNLRVFTSLMYTARTRLAIVSPYFVPDESLLASIITAAQRGVRVELYVGEQADQFMVDRAQSSYYEALLEAGVEIYLYPAPQVLHTKAFVVDDTYAVLGSSNMDMRSLGLNYEISLLATGGDIVPQLLDVIERYRELSRLLTEDEWKRRSVMRRYSESVMRLTSALQ